MTPSAPLTRAALATQLQGQLTSMLNPRDTPRSWGERQTEAYEQRRRSLTSTIRALLDPTIGVSSTDALEDQRDRLLALRAPIEQLIAEAPSLDTTGWDPRAYRREAERQKGLVTALELLQHGGVSYWPNGNPMLPAPLADLLRKTCPTCQHTTLEWPGCLDDVEAAIAATEKKARVERQQLDSLLRGAAALLAEPMPMPDAPMPDLDLVPDSLSVST
jgi:hypothetical protein